MGATTSARAYFSRMVRTDVPSLLIPDSNPVSSWATSTWRLGDPVTTIELLEGSAMIEILSLPVVNAPSASMAEPSAPATSTA